MTMATKKMSAAAEVRALEKKAKLKVGGKKKQTQFTSFSFTRYNDHKQCPLKAKLKHLDKIEEPPNEAMDRGAAIGRLAEMFLKGETKKLPDALSKFADKFKEIRDLKKKHPQRVIIEDNWTLTKDWSITKWNDWDGAYARVKIDAAYLSSPTTMVLIDWKTGKYRAEKREEYIEQLELYALSALAVNPQLEKVEAFLCYLDVGVTFPSEPDEVKSLTFTRHDVPNLKRLWDRRVRAMMLAKAFPPRPTDKCRYCHYRKDNAAMMPGRKALCKF